MVEALHVACKMLKIQCWFVYIHYFFVKKIINIFLFNSQKRIDIISILDKISNAFWQTCWGNANLEVPAMP